MDQRSLLPLEVGRQLADVVFQAPDAKAAPFAARVRSVQRLRQRLATQPLHPASPSHNAVAGVSAVTPATG
jgi:hypothetical protein